MSKIFKLLSIMPISASFRGKLYKLIVGGEKIGEDFKIGFGSFIDAQSIHVGNNVSIGNLVRIKNLDMLELGDNSSIGSSTIVCGALSDRKVMNRDLIIGKGSNILSAHYFDVVAPITIGSNVTIAGRLTQLYTHSFDLDSCRVDAPITIGNDIYIGASCLINMGVTICDKVVLQGGTCVNKSITEQGVYTSTTFSKRGEVRKYEQLYGKCRTLYDGQKIYIKDNLEKN